MNSMARHLGLCVVAILLHGCGGGSHAIDILTVANGDSLSHALPYTETSLGGNVTLNVSMVTYVAPLGVASKTDHFVYAATDARGSVAAAVIAVDIGK